MASTHVFTNLHTHMLKCVHACSHTPHPYSYMSPHLYRHACTYLLTYMPTYSGEGVIQKDSQTKAKDGRTWPWFWLGRKCDISGALSFQPFILTQALRDGTKANPSQNISRFSKTFADFTNHLFYPFKGLSIKVLDSSRGLTPDTASHPLGSTGFWLASLLLVDTNNVTARTTSELMSEDFTLRGAWGTKECGSGPGPPDLHEGAESPWQDIVLHIWHTPDPCLQQEAVMLMVVMLTM